MKNSKEMKWNFFLRMFLELILDTSIIVMISLSGMTFKNPTVIFSALLSLLVLVLIIAYILWIPYFAIRNFAKMRLLGDKFCADYWSMYGEFRVGSKMTLFYNFYFVLRRFMYAVLIVFLQKYPLCQAIGMVLLTLPLVLYHLILKPFKEMKLNFLMAFNESLLAINSMGFFLFKSPNNPGVTSILGWILCGLIVLNIFLNFLYMWILKVRDICRGTKMYLRERRDRKRRKREIMKNMGQNTDESERTQAKMNKFERDEEKLKLDLVMTEDDSSIGAYLKDEKDKI